MDEYVINSLGEFEGKRLLSVNSPEVDLGDLEQGGEALDETTLAQLNEWLKTELGETVEEVRGSKRLLGAPVLAITPEGGLTPQMRQMMRAMKPDEVPQVKVILEINPSHDLVRKLEQTRQTNPQLAALMGAQLLDNALLSAGLLDEPQRMVSRLEKLMANLPT
jgi:molecular chaperone HtpG